MSQLLRFFKCLEKTTTTTVTTMTMATRLCEEPTLSYGVEVFGPTVSDVLIR